MKYFFEKNENKIIKKKWLLIGHVFLFCFLFSLFLQYQWDMLPCLYCIYIRTATLYVALLAYACYFFWHHSIIRSILSFLSLLSAFWGMMMTYQLYHLQNLDLDGFELLQYSCEFEPNFILPWHKWFPAVFMPQSSCLEATSTFLFFPLYVWAFLQFLFLIVYLILIFYQNYRTFKSFF